MSATLEKLEDLVYNGFKEMREESEKTDREIKETGRMLKSMIKEHNGLSKSISLFSETMVVEALIQLFKQRGIILRQTGHRERSRVDGESMEIDALGIGPEVVVAAEVKVKLDIDNIKWHLGNLERFFEFFPQHRNLTLYGAVAGMSIADQVVRFAEKQGLFVFLPSGETMQFANPADFMPKTYRYQS